MTFFHRKIKFKSPPKIDILIFERLGSQRIENIVLPGSPAYIFDSKLEEVFVSVKIIYYFIIYLRHFRLQGVGDVRKLGNEVLGQLWRIYILSCIKGFLPKVVVTSIDNYSVFHWLCAHYPDAEFMAIQNGSRTRVEFKGRKMPYRIGHLFCFGKYEQDMYSELGYKIDHYYPVGSLLASYYKYRDTEKSAPEYDICVVSCWRGNIGNGPDVQRTMESMRKMDLFISRYIQEYELKASVLLRSAPDSPDRCIPVYGDEKDYYKGIYPESAVLISPDFKERNIYREMDKSNFIVSFGSTAVREAFGWGKKVLYCDFTGTKLYNDYDPVILFETENYDLFKKRFNEIRGMPYEEYRRDTKAYAAYVMGYDFNCPAHLFIRQKITQYASRL